MKIKHFLFFVVVSISLPLIGIGLAAQSGDLRGRTRPPPMPRTLQIDKVGPAIQTLCSHAVTRAIQHTGDANTAENVSGYLREVGRVFAGMETNVNFSVEHLNKTISEIPSPLTTQDDYTSETRTFILSLYKLAYYDRVASQDSPVEWLSKVCVLLRNSIDTGLKDAGRVGINP